MIEVRAARPDEYEAVGALCDRAFQAMRPVESWPFPPQPEAGEPGRSLEHNIVRAVTREHPDFVADCLRVALHDGRPAAMALFTPCRLRVGRTVVAGNVVGPVGVEPELQRQGYGTAVMQDALAAMSGAGHLLSHLWGHPGYYDRFGYSPAFPYSGVTAEIETLQVPAALPPGWQMVPVEPRHFGRLAALWNENTATHTLSDVRDESPWLWQPQVPAAAYAVLLNADGTPMGYYQATAAPGRLTLFDAAIRDAAAGAALLAHLRQVAIEWGAAELELALSPNHPLARAAWQAGARVHTQFTPAGFARVLNLPALFEALREEFNHRLAHSELHNHTGMLAVRCEEGASTVALRGGLVQGVMSRAVAGAPVLEIPLAQLNPLLTGLRPLAEILAQPNVSLPAGMRRLAEVLFPAGYPHPPGWPVFQH